MSTIFPHMMWPSWKFRMHVWNVLHAARWQYRTQKLRKNRHLRTIAQFCRAISSQIRYISTIGKTLLNSNISSTSPHNMINVGLLTAEICWRVWGTPGNFNEFRVLASLLQRKSSKLCMMFGRLLGWYIIYTFWGLLPLTEFCQVQNSLCVQVLRYPILAALLHDTRAVGVSQTLRRGIFIRQSDHPVQHWAVELSSCLQWTTVMKLLMHAQRSYSILK